MRVRRFERTKRHADGRVRPVSEDLARAPTRPYTFMLAGAACANFTPFTVGLDVVPLTSVSSNLYIYSYLKLDCINAIIKWRRAFVRQRASTIPAWMAAFDKAPVPTVVYFLASGMTGNEIMSAIAASVQSIEMMFSD
ncbi:hypothetical protein EVAR_92139_1 [Eumeta japonica]|uniref:Uncharacterized protein n=1 Tax=Eumeta variegata TaxID=151549 RepID=A0A4C1SYD2_EUMVA|nr:hypothetical protein EVAR_92139_1 [Eumeta japonica]